MTLCTYGLYNLAKCHSDYQVLFCSLSQFSLMHTFTKMQTSQNTEEYISMITMWVPQNESWIYSTHTHTHTHTITVNYFSD
jgi:hypothetical protein